MAGTGSAKASSWTSRSAEGTARFAANLARLARAGDVIVLSGDLGAGKTCFAQGFARGAGVRAPVTSPTFALLHQYDGASMPVYHADVYRLESFGELAELGFDELDDGVLLVEWGEAVAAQLGDHLTVTIGAGEDASSRQIGVAAVGEAWQDRADELAEVVAAARDGEAGRG